MDPSQVAAAVNLGNAYVKSGRVRDAVRLWQGALARSPGLESVRVSLAVALYRGGDRAGAEDALVQVLALNPANAMARKLLDEVRPR